MTYLIKHGDQETGPFTVEQIQEMLASMRIGRKTLCRPSDGSARYAPLQDALPDVFQNVEQQRAALMAARTQRQMRTSLSSATPEEIELLAKDLIITTETAFSDLATDRRLGIISGEVVYGVNFFRDLLTGVRDIVGGRSGSLQNVLRDARKTVLTELKREAPRCGADAVIGVTVNYQELAGGGKEMVLLAAVGTAVTLKREA